MSTNLKNNSTPFEKEEWISQADAARLRGVSRQAINKLIKSGRLRTVEVAGFTFVFKKDVENFVAQPAGRKKTK